MGRNSSQMTTFEITPPDRKICSIRGLHTGWGILSGLWKRHWWYINNKNGFFRPKRTPSRRSRRKRSRTSDDSSVTDVRDFVATYNAECHYVNGTQRVRYLDRCIYNQEEFVYFDSDEGKYIAKTEFGKPTADQWNSDKEMMEDQRNRLERICIYNYGWLQGLEVIGREVEPKIKISLMSQYERPHTKQHILLCNVYGFFPSEIEVKWYRNDEEQTEQVEFTEPHHNGDWSYQMEVMLETEIQKGDMFTCEVHHKSLKAPHRVNWHPESSDSAKNKMATGIVGIVLGLVFFIVGLVIYMRGRKVQASFPGHQNERFLSQ